MCERKNSHKNVENCAKEVREEKTVNVLKKENIVNFKEVAVEREEILRCFEKVRFMRMRYMTKEEELEDLKKFDKVNSAEITDLPKSKHDMTDVVSRLVIEKESLKEKIVEEKLCYLLEYLAAKELIRMADDGYYREILERRYFLNQNWSDIAVQLGFTRQHINRMHNEAIAQISQKVKDVLECYINFMVML